MPPRAIYLVTSRNSPSQRAHFSIFVPSVACSTIGTSIHVVGAPMMGYQLEFKRNHALSSNEEPYETVLLGHVDSQHIADSLKESSSMYVDHTSRSDLEIAASQIPAPRVSENFMAPVNDVSNSRVPHCLCSSLTYTDHQQEMSRVDYGICSSSGCSGST
ncbi:uncharacterized protein AKAW2_30535A [Aspergillus luchuensis]|uniref:Uncharacterized protein n=1 Tax=Aspergillus kawachii TaxID=1069201 RepID=A0A7R7W6K0_ASPKA|nr:uncharacterized protein AKAW2_30535A [Aspergillus luchuensis]BCR97216.1 hypothetical protein AKAW2_30535A [Aspergillus luchuensis]